MTPAEARACVRALRVGAAPARADLLSSGRQGVSTTLRRALSGPAEGKAPILVEGAWGAGKSHTLALALAIARDLDRPSVAVVFDARGLPLSHPNRLYAAVAAGIQLGDQRGLRAVAMRIFGAAALPDEAWWAHRSGPPVFWRALRTLWSAWADGDHWLFSQSWAWSVLFGIDLAARDDVGRRDAAIVRLGQLADWLSGAGLGPLLVCGDEVESLANLWNVTARISAYNALGQLLSVPGIGWMFGAAGNFGRVIAGDLERGVADAWRLRDGGRRFLRLWSEGRFLRIQPLSLTVEDAEEIAQRLAEVYGLAYGLPPEEAAGASAVAAWAEDPARNPRRLARAVIAAFDEVREAGPVFAMGSAAPGRAKAAV